MDLCLSGETRTQLFYSCTCFSFIITHAAHCVDFTAGAVDRSAHVDVVLQMQLADCHTYILAGDRFASIIFRPHQRTFVIVDPVVLQGVGWVCFGVFYKEQNGQEVS